ncbi:salivary glue protein Sgs-3-like [Pimephales promelas]|uniref:salivary glue protein Sgs-3-like n=1 Tax=Pimephales promelas TaxID=90988 RepID=UPI0019558806|nr:salivary glue protein Sgs-3-like [Pimephales promelas]
MKFSLFSAVLFSIAWMSVVGTGDGHPVACCYPTDIKPPVENIVKYDMQDPALCGIRAVRFYTKKNKVVCSDPESKYAKKAMCIVDRRTTTTPTICYTSTTDTIPTVGLTTTNKTPGKKTETSTSTTTSRIVPTIETFRPETETTKTTNRPTSVSKKTPESSLSTVTTCGTGGPTSPPTETRRETPEIHLNTLKTTHNTGTISGVTNKTSPTTKKLSKLIIRKKGKSRKRLSKFQMGIHNKNKP